MGETTAVIGPSVKSQSSLPASPTTTTTTTTLETFETLALAPQPELELEPELGREPEQEFEPESEQQQQVVANTAIAEGDEEALANREQQQQQQHLQEASSTGQIYSDTIYDACDTPVQDDANPATMGAIVETEKKIFTQIELLLTQIKGLRDNELKEMLDKFIAIYRYSFERCVFLPYPEGCEETDPHAALRHHLSLRLDQWNEWFADKGVDRTLGRRFKDPNSKNKARMEGDEARGLEEMKQRIQQIEQERLYEAELQKYQADQEKLEPIIPTTTEEAKRIEKEKKSEERRNARAERAKEKKRQKDVEFLRTVTLESAVGFVDEATLEIYKAKCHLCEDRLTDAKFMIIHEKIKHPMMFFCHYCDRTFAAHGPMRVHCESVHLGLPIDPPGRRPPERANCTKGNNNGVTATWITANTKSNSNNNSIVNNSNNMPASKSLNMKGGTMSLTSTGTKSRKTGSAANNIKVGTSEADELNNEDIGSERGAISNKSNRRSNISSVQQSRVKVSNRGGRGGCRGSRRTSKRLKEAEKGGDDVECDVGVDGDVDIDIDVDRTDKYEDDNIQLSQLMKPKKQSLTAATSVKQSAENDGQQPGPSGVSTRRSSQRRGGRGGRRVGVGAKCSITTVPVGNKNSNSNNDGNEDEYVEVENIDELIVTVEEQDHNNRNNNINNEIGNVDQTRGGRRRSERIGKEETEGSRRRRRKIRSQAEDQTTIVGDITTRTGAGIEALVETGEQRQQKMSDRTGRAGEVISRPSSSGSGSKARSRTGDGDDQQSRPISSISANASEVGHHEHRRHHHHHDWVKEGSSGSNSTRRRKGRNDNDKALTMISDGMDDGDKLCVAVTADVSVGIAFTSSTRSSGIGKNLNRVQNEKVHQQEEIVDSGNGIVVDGKKQKKRQQSSFMAEEKRRVDSDIIINETEGEVNQRQQQKYINDEALSNREMNNNTNNDMMAMMSNTNKGCESDMAVAVTLAAGKDDIRERRRSQECGVSEEICEGLRNNYNEKDYGYGSEKTTAIHPTTEKSTVLIGTNCRDNIGQRFPPFREYRQRVWARSRKCAQKINTEERFYLRSNNNNNINDNMNNNNINNMHSNNINNNNGNNSDNNNSNNGINETIKNEFIKRSSSLPPYGIISIHEQYARNALKPSQSENDLVKPFISSAITTNIVEVLDKFLADPFSLTSDSSSSSSTSSSVECGAWMRSRSMSSVGTSLSSAPVVYRKKTVLRELGIANDLCDSGAEAEAQTQAQLGGASITSATATQSLGDNETGDTGAIAANADIHTNATTNSGGGDSGIAPLVADITATTRTIGDVAVVGGKDNLVIRASDILRSLSSLSSSSSSSSSDDSDSDSDSSSSTDSSSDSDDDDGDKMVTDKTGLISGNETTTRMLLAQLRQLQSRRNAANIVTDNIQNINNCNNNGESLSKTTNRMQNLCAIPLPCSTSEMIPSTNTSLRNANDEHRKQQRPKPSLKRKSETTVIGSFVRPSSSKQAATRAAATATVSSSSNISACSSVPSLNSASVHLPIRPTASGSTSSPMTTEHIPTAIASCPASGPLKLLRGKLRATQILAKMRDAVLARQKQQEQEGEDGSSDISSSDSDDNDSADKMISPSIKATKKDKGKKGEPQGSKDRAITRASEILARMRKVVVQSKTTEDPNSSSSEEEGNNDKGKGLHDSDRERTKETNDRLKHGTSETKGILKARQILARLRQQAQQAKTVTEDDNVDDDDSNDTDDTTATATRATRTKKRVGEGNETKPRKKRRDAGIKRRRKAVGSELTTANLDSGICTTDNVGFRQKRRGIYEFTSSAEELDEEGTGAQSASTKAKTRTQPGHYQTTERLDKSDNLAPALSCRRVSGMTSHSEAVRKQMQQQNEQQPVESVGLPEYIGHQREQAVLQVQQPVKRSRGRPRKIRKVC